MPLKHDPEWQEELDRLISETKAKSSGPAEIMAALGIVLGAILFILIGTDASEVLHISVMLIAGILCIAWIIVREARALHITLAVLIATVEWTGRKQLGEYDPK